MRPHLLTSLAASLLGIVAANPLVEGGVKAVGNRAIKDTVRRTSVPGTPTNKFAARTTSVAAAAGDGTVTYTVVPGDTLLKIATKLNSGVCQIASLNKIPDPSFISVGQVLQVPTPVAIPDNRSCVKTKTSSFTPSATQSVDANGTVTVTVVKGDTLTIISKKFNSGICDIARVNNIANPDLIEDGQVLRVPINVRDPDDSSCLPDNQAAAPAKAANSTATVPKGEGSGQEKGKNATEATARRLFGSGV